MGEEEKNVHHLSSTECTDHLHLFAWSCTFVYKFLTCLQVFVYIT